MIRFAYNPTTQPVDIDPEGHQLEGHGWRHVDDETEQVQAAYTRGALVDADKPPKDGTPTAQAAWADYQTATHEGGDGT